MSLPKRLRGFTLIELVLVSAMIAALLGSGFYLTIKSLRRQTLRSSAQQLVTSIRETQNNAFSGVNLCPQGVGAGYTRPEGWYIKISKQSENYAINYRCKDPSTGLVAVPSPEYKLLKLSKGVKTERIKHNLPNSPTAACNATGDYFLHFAIITGTFSLFAFTPTSTSPVPNNGFTIKLWDMETDGTKLEHSRTVDVKKTVGSASERAANTPDKAFCDLYPT